ncbi:MAG: DJ-1/PfpI family protein [Kangiellaceae bacterium]|nr:DJ-1/PfpI family protein [Kangiellaceae bacterium]MCW8999010.1 DJ-1/PfpI family protein [Kangiellaceae bacterium]
MDVLIPVANGSEEMEVVIVADVLTRAGAKVILASVEKEPIVVASRGIKIQADHLMPDIENKDWDLIVIPGGMPGAERLANCLQLQQLIRDQIEQTKTVAAICAAPSVVLAEMGMLRGKEATCHPGFWEKLAPKVKTLREDRVVVDLPFITSQGPGTAFEFALELVDLLFGADKRREVAEPMVL